MADKLSIIRNITFNECLEGHNPPLVYTGYYNSTAKPSHRPTFGSVASHFLGKNVRGLPSYVAFDGMDTKPGRSAHALDVAHNPYVPSGKNSGLSRPDGVSLQRLDDRGQLLRSLDRLRSDVDGEQGARHLGQSRPVGYAWQ